MLLALQAVASLLYLVILGMLFLYGMKAYIMIVLHWWNRCWGQAAEPPAPAAVWPMVTVQLPLYNERCVARRLLETVGALDYPTDRLEIQVLDDSTDETTEILAKTTMRLREKGLRVTHLRRGERTGFKAGALAAGLREAHGEFVYL
jgi:cellulose synthase/poly-beta-1,6-N-acetylglucosamine synthase-like glycosyltransferase